MKKLLLTTTVLLTAFAVRADIIITQKMESAMMNGEMTMKIKGEKGRVDMPAGPAGAMSMIIDGVTGDVSTVMHGQKMVMKMGGAQLKSAVEQAKKAGGDVAVEKPKATGTKEKIGQWDTEIFETKSGGQSGRIWVAKDFPNAAKIKAEMMKMSKAMGQSAMDAATMDLPGMPVKTEVETPVGKMTMTITKAVEQPVDAAEFEVPKDYKEMAMPAIPK